MGFELRICKQQSEGRWSRQLQLGGMFLEEHLASNFCREVKKELESRSLGHIWVKISITLLLPVDLIKAYPSLGECFANSYKADHVLAYDNDLSFLHIYSMPDSWFVGLNNTADPARLHAYFEIPWCDRSIGWLQLLGIIPQGVE